MIRACILLAAVSVRCGETEAREAECGPDLVVVSRVLDGDTVELTDGRRVRVIGIDAPETGECYADEATEYLRSLVEGQPVMLRYDEATCVDRYGRTLAHIASDDGDVAELQVLRGHACAYAVSPTGDDVMAMLQEYEWSARAEARGLWSCAKPPECTR